MAARRFGGEGRRGRRAWRRPTPVHVNKTNVAVFTQTEMEKRAKRNPRGPGACAPLGSPGSTDGTEVPRIAPRISISRTTRALVN